MQSALDQFRSNIVHVRNIGGLYTSVGSVTTAAVDLSDLLRTQLVMCVSSLDHYIHEVTRLGMLQTLSGQRPATPAFLRYNISVNSALQAVNLYLPMASPRNSRDLWLISSESPLRSYQAAGTRDSHVDP